MQKGLEETVFQLKIQNKKLTEEVDGLAMKNSVLLQLNESLRAQVEASKETVSSPSILANGKRQIEDLSEQVKQLKGVIERLREDNDNLESEKNNLIVELEKAAENELDLEERNYEKEDELVSCKKELEDFKESLRALFPSSNKPTDLQGFLSFFEQKEQDLSDRERQLDKRDRFLEEKAKSLTNKEELLAELEKELSNMTQARAYQSNASDAKNIFKESPPTKEKSTRDEYKSKGYNTTEVKTYEPTDMYSADKGLLMDRSLHSTMREDKPEEIKSNTYEAVKERMKKKRDPNGPDSSLKNSLRSSIQESKRLYPVVDTNRESHFEDIDQPELNYESRDPNKITFNPSVHSNNDYYDGFIKKHKPDESERYSNGGDYGLRDSSRYNAMVNGKERSAGAGYEDNSSRYSHANHNSLPSQYKYDPNLEAMRQSEKAYETPQQLEQYQDPVMYLNSSHKKQGSASLERNSEEKTEDKKPAAKPGQEDPNQKKAVAFDLFDESIDEKKRQLLIQRLEKGRGEKRTKDKSLSPAPSINNPSGSGSVKINNYITAGSVPAGPMSKDTASDRSIDRNNGQWESVGGTTAGVNQRKEDRLSQQGGRKDASPSLGYREQWMKDKDGKSSGGVPSNDVSPKDRPIDIIRNIGKGPKREKSNTPQ
jgi:hypothetical protein